MSDEINQPYNDEWLLSLFVYLICMAMMFGGLYGLVRFVKWAWVN